ncbi:hypothetical protein G6F50_017117 [Rhizopus delemar]|uniref:Uncharacterized protein n=1 Tax=Rhizopus delemar TaxID=936053 RepID=A0A9P6XR76_9FUNG|nr:hypothetical protein G6F50_017117 [Rhizopus delemar]
MPARSNTPVSINEELSANGPSGVDGSPAITKQRSTPASATARVTKDSSSASEAIRRAERCGMGTKPSARTARAAANLASLSWPGR